MKKMLSDKTFLVVDDEPLFLEILVDLLERHGATVETACDGQEAFNKIQMKPFDVVMTDIRMPNMDGITFLKLLNKVLDVKPGIYIVSAFNDLSKEDQIKLNVLKHFGKPIQEEKLLDEITTFFRQNGQNSD